MPLSSRIKELREERKISVKKFAADIGVSDVIVYRWQSGEAVPNLTTAIRIADYFCISLDSLVGRTASFDDGSTQMQRVTSIEDFPELGIRKGDILTVEQVKPGQVTDGMYVIHANHPVLITLNEKQQYRVLMTVNTKLTHILPSVDDIPQPLLKIKGIYHPVY
ncbi:MAG: helix-turn-helix transcriptional regulator [Oxalobacter sp.]|nr:helix-turn-helix transcriptional regulator [Oxalobacter sp.]